MQNDIAEARLLRKKNMVSLNEAERRKEWDAQEARLASRESRRGTDKQTNEDAAGKELATGKGRSFWDDGLQANERNLAKELAAEKERKNAKDVFLNEAINILSDEVGALKTSVKFVARVKPVFPLTPD